MRNDIACTARIDPNFSLESAAVVVTRSSLPRQELSTVYSVLR